MSPRNASKDIATIIGLAAGIVALLACCNFAVDPLQIFHRPWFYQARYTSDPRLGNAGLIESQPFDTAFMGTSYSYAIRQEEIDGALGGRSLKLTISGGTSKEQLTVISASLRKAPRRIVWQMDDFMFRDSEPVDKFMDADLYSRSYSGLFRYLFSLHTGRESLWIVLGLWKPTRRLGYRLNEIGYLKFDRDDPTEINTIPSDADLRPLFNAANAEAAFRLYIETPQLITEGISERMVDNFGRDAASLIDAHRAQEFIVYFPPSSILYPTAMKLTAPCVFDMIQRLHEHQLLRLSRMPNVRVFDFRVAEHITHDLSLYRDTIHYSPSTNLKLLSLIVAGQYQVSASDPAASIILLRNQVNKFIDRRFGLQAPACPSADGMKSDAGG